MELEKVFPELVVFGRYQRLIYWLVLLPIQLCYYCHLYSHLFVSHQPDHWCNMEPVLTALNTSMLTVTSSIHERPNVNPTSSSLFSISNLLDNVQLQRYFFIPPVEQPQIDGSFQSYLNSLSSCHQYDMNYDQLFAFHRHHFYQMFASKLSNKSFESIMSAPTKSCTNWTFNRTQLGADQTIVTRVSMLFL